MTGNTNSVSHMRVPPGCGTCKAKILSGSVAMEHNFALSQADLASGYVLTCQAHPTTPTVSIDYDA